jgi:hypothetical protein
VNASSNASGSSCSAGRQALADTGPNRQHLTAKSGARARQGHQRDARHETLWHFDQSLRHEARLVRCRQVRGPRAQLGLAGVDAWQPATGTASTTYRVSYDLSESAPNTVQSSEAATTFVWEAQTD